MSASEHIQVYETSEGIPLSIGEGGELSTERIFKVKLRDVSESSAASELASAAAAVLVLQHPSIPKWHSTHPKIPGVWCVAITPELTKNDPNIWIVRCAYKGIDIPGRVAVSSYSSYFGSGSTMGSVPFLESDLPWHQPPKMVEEEATEYEEITGRAYGEAGFHKITGTSDAFYASDGAPNYGENSPFLALAVAASDPLWDKLSPVAPIVNAAGELYDDPPGCERALRPYTFTWAVSAPSAIESDTFFAKWWSLKDSMNASGIQIMGISIPAFTGRVRDAKTRLSAFMGFPYYELTLTVEIKESTWVTPVINQGYSYLLSGVLTPYTDESLGDHKQRAAKLDASGGKLANSELSDPYWGFYVMRPWKSWSFLGLPSSAYPSSL
jgi:hypothetical protein